MKAQTIMTISKMIAETTIAKYGCCSFKPGRESIASLSIAEFEKMTNGRPNRQMIKPSQ